jgi:hypothetical protein
MIERELLQDIGFQRGAGDWPCEVWVYEGMFWVWFGDIPDSARFDLTTIDGRSVTREEFFNVFIEAVKDEQRDLCSPGSW